MTLTDPDYLFTTEINILKHLPRCTFTKNHAEASKRSTASPMDILFIIMHPLKCAISLADLGGGARPARAPPYGSRFFHFDMQNFRNVAASGVHSLPYEVHAPPTGNPGSTTALADLGGACPPYGSRFFCFDMQNFRNVAASGVHSLPYKVHAPPYGKSWICHCIGRSRGHTPPLWVQILSF